jgi:hypothetical protein
MANQIIFRLLLGFFLFNFAYQAIGQVGISMDDATPDPSAILDIKDTERGLLVPRLTLVQRRNLATNTERSAAHSLVVFDYESNMFYFWNLGTRTWNSINPWTLADNMDGDLSNDHLVFAGVGNVGIGTTNLNSKLDVQGSIEVSATYKMRDTDVLVNNSQRNFLAGIGAGGNFLPSVRGNTVIGDKAAGGFQTGDDNVIIGTDAAGGSITDHINGSVFIGARAGQSVKKGPATGFPGYPNYNTYIGLESGMQCGGYQNTFVGSNSGSGKTLGNNNTFFGFEAGKESGTGFSNILIGSGAGRNLGNGEYNICIGGGTGYDLSGSKNICIGEGAGAFGDENNIVIGHSPATGLSSGSNNILIGNKLSIMGSNNLAIGTLIRGDFDLEYVFIDGQLVVDKDIVMNGHIKANSFGDLVFDSRTWHKKGLQVDGKTILEELEVKTGPCIGCASDSTLKRNMTPITSSLEKIISLNGYTYLWKEHTEQYKNQKEIQMGLMAQEVQKQFPLLVDTAKAGYLYIDYQKMVVPLVEAVKELKAELDEKEKRLRDLEAIQSALDQKERHVQEMEARLDKLEQLIRPKN